MALPTATLRASRPFLPVAAGLFCIQLDFFSLGLALPTIAVDLGTTVTDLQWLLSGYMIALGAVLIPAGRLGEMLGRREVLLTGIAVFGLSSLVCGVATSVPVLIAARAVQGVGAALIMPAGFALVTNATTEQERPKVIGVLLGVSGVGTALGPVLGGVLSSTVGWRWVFLVNVPVALLALWSGRRLRTSRDEEAGRDLRRLDWWGVLTVVGGLVAVSVAIDDVGVQGWTTPATWGPLLGGIALLVAFGIREHHAAAPLVRPSLVRNRLFVVLCAAGTLANIGTVTYVVAATIDLQTLRGLSAAAAGLAFVVSSVGLAACGPLSGWLTTKVPAGLVMAVAVLACPPALVLLAFARSLPLYVLALGLCGLTTGMGYGLGQLAVQNVLPPQQSAEGSGVMLTSLICFGGIGVVAATAVIEAVGPRPPTSAGLALALLTVAALLLVAGVATLISQWPRRRAPRTVSV
ncbi:MFS transporter [Actinomycetospora callitridis]|uniref:MFS transporter n=1 Tax=Actinomycetospora callitridis TaxID=913944 RepID=UPI0023671601|nr:MFS transporter [Actinomycetospora callitridis]MDD7917823.1 MFS transporter [Actinomycetospora callitridis]